MWPMSHPSRGFRLLDLDQKEALPQFENQEGESSHGVRRLCQVSPFQPKQPNQKQHLSYALSSARMWVRQDQIPPLPELKVGTCTQVSNLLAKYSNH